MFPLVSTQSGSDLLLLAVERLQAEAASALPPQAALERLRVLMTARERLAAVALEAVHDGDVRELYALDGAGSLRGWLRAQPSGDDGQLSLARRLVLRPLVAQALSSGVIGVKVAGQLCTALDKVPAEVADELVAAILVDGVGGILQVAQGGRPDRLLTEAELAQRQADAGELAQAADRVELSPVDRIEPGLVLLARRMSPQLLGTALRQLVSAVLPDGSDAEPTDPYFLELRPLMDGDWDLRGLLDPATGAALVEELARRQQDTDERQAARDAVHLRLKRLFGLPDQAADFAQASGGADDVEAGRAADLALFDACLAEVQDPGYPCRTGRFVSVGRQRHDALATLLQDARETDSDVATGATSSAPSPAALTVTCSLASLLGEPGAVPGLLHRPGLPPVPLPAATLQRLGCDSILSAVLTDAAGHPVGAAGSHRSATLRERRALRTQWGPTCAVQGCSNTRTVPHHVVPWWLAKQTVLKDLAPLCEHCHHDLHEGRRTLRLRDGRWIDERGWARQALSA